MWMAIRSRRQLQVAGCHGAQFVYFPPVPISVLGLGFGFGFGLSRPIPPKENLEARAPIRPFTPQALRYAPHCFATRLLQGSL